MENFSDVNSLWLETRAPQAAQLAPSLNYSQREKSQQLSEQINITQRKSKNTFESTYFLKSGSRSLQPEKQELRLVINE
ncbi:hypothetical protein TTHERM_00637000 (macronuclear) [Tetrahymena thermophila SB210]|uniref:Uncharacterized protein n=1 Tax=Tetrahymena thermophila (strain SB210) TaxID=312017 RepID=Q22HK3_TETTS|nr:hypothetical protein TTHERM_00637000 [Tetrahymena thermophila SB210]EAR84698.1 hypothetical protein TTHERM_00637000 [Tetrahymena thermophila SB210]|eukprot:XP_001032361.1 hypothetical protein TTHERM_00637000 [Tetrahymena thermophila SB210]